ncbi:MAG: hypothetical protein JWO89_3792, partial [Verrucomicrobiaceae bacterium]|nr:hypothetical protein [Verrucomicrobiaceae bacterium]
FRGRGSVRYFLHATVTVMPTGAASSDKMRATVLSNIEEKYPEATHESVSGPHGEADYLTYRRDRSEFTDHLSNTKAAFSAVHLSGVELHAYQRGEFTVLYRFDFATVRRNDFSRTIAGFMKTFEAQQEVKSSVENGINSHS